MKSSAVNYYTIIVIIYIMSIVLEQLGQLLLQLQLQLRLLWLTEFLTEIWK